MSLTWGTSEGLKDCCPLHPPPQPQTGLSFYSLHIWEPSSTVTSSPWQVPEPRTGTHPAPPPLPHLRALQKHFQPFPSTPALAHVLSFCPGSFAGFRPLFVSQSKRMNVCFHGFLAGLENGALRCLVGFFFFFFLLCTLLKASFLELWFTKANRGVCRWPSAPKRAALLFVCTLPSGAAPGAGWRSPSVSSH